MSTFGGPGVREKEPGSPRRHVIKKTHRNSKIVATSDSEYMGPGSARPGSPRRLIQTFACYLINPGLSWFGLSACIKPTTYVVLTSKKISSGLFIRLLIKRIRTHQFVYDFSDLMSQAFQSAKMFVSFSSFSLVIRLGFRINP